MPRIYLPIRDRVKARLRKRAERACPVLGRCTRCRRRKAQDRHHFSVWLGFEDAWEPLCRKCHRRAEREKPTAPSAGPADREAS